MTPHLQASLGSQLDAASSVILANGWAARERLDQVRKQLSAIDLGPTKDSIANYLARERVITREQAGELDTIIRHQAYFPIYKLLRKVGSGGMGTVYLAIQLTTGRECALKTINTRLAEDGDFISRFHRETKALTGVRHDHIAEIFESGENEGHCYLAMEYIDGPSLMDLLKEHKVLPEIYALRIVRQVAEGLGFAFAQAGLVHRDIKPENVLIIRAKGSDVLFPASDVAKLIDFGLVKSSRDNDHLTQTGMTIGTPLYMSPEQIRGEPLDARSDIYGLGATLYHLLTGITPYHGTSPGAIMSAHLTDQVPDPATRVPGLNPATRQVVTTALAKKLDDRFVSMAAMVAAIDRALAEIAERANGTLGLLRKPLVLKGPQTKRREVDAGVGRAMEEKPISTRIIQKHRDAKTIAAAGADAGAKHPTDRIHPAMPAPPRPPAAFPSPLPMPRPGTDRIGATAMAAGDQPSARDPSSAERSSVAPSPRSAVFDEDPAKSSGIGFLPWVVLGGAVIVVVLWFMFASGR